VLPGDDAAKGKASEIAGMVLTLKKTNMSLSGAQWTAAQPHLRSLYEMSGEAISSASHSAKFVTK
jgi:hypothetical protein